MRIFFPLSQTALLINFPGTIAPCWFGLAIGVGIFSVLFCFETSPSPTRDFPSVIASVFSPSIANALPGILAALGWLFSNPPYSCFVFIAFFISSAVLSTSLLSICIDLYICEIVLEWIEFEEYLVQACNRGRRWMYRVFFSAIESTRCAPRALLQAFAQLLRSFWNVWFWKLVILKSSFRTLLRIVKAKLVTSSLIIQISFDILFHYLKNLKIYFDSVIHAEREICFINFNGDHFLMSDLMKRGKIHFIYFSKIFWKSSSRANLEFQNRSYSSTISFLEAAKILLHRRAKSSALNGWIAHSFDFFPRLTWS